MLRPTCHRTTAECSSSGRFRPSAISPGRQLGRATAKTDFQRAAHAAKPATPASLFTIPLRFVPLAGALSPRDLHRETRQLMMKIAVLHDRRLLALSARSTLATLKILPTASLSTYATCTRRPGRQYRAARTARPGGFHRRRRHPHGRAAIQRLARSQFQRRRVLQQPPRRHRPEARLRIYFRRNSRRRSRLAIRLVLDQLWPGTDEDARMSRQPRSKACWPRLRRICGHAACC